jgi:hypothetical protein
MTKKLFRKDFEKQVRAEAENWPLEIVEDWIYFEKASLNTLLRGLTVDDAYDVLKSYEKRAKEAGLEDIKIDGSYERAYITGKRPENGIERERRINWEIDKRLNAAREERERPKIEAKERERKQKEIERLQQQIEELKK